MKTLAHALVIWGGLSLLSSQAMAGLKPGVVINASETRTKAVVLMFVANETALSAAETQNNQVLQSWLRNFGSKQSVQSADNIAFDEVNFKEFIDTDTAEIRAGVLASQAKVSALIFTNRLAKAGTFEYFRGGVDRGFQKGVFNRSRESQFIADSNPFATDSGFREALRLAAETFDPAEHRFILVTKSHGSPEALMRTKVLVDTDKLNEPEFQRRLRSLPRAFGASEKGPDLGVQERTGVESYEKAFEIERVGLSKSQYVDNLLEVASEYSLRFDLAFAFACSSALSDAQIRRLKVPTNPVAIFFGSDDKGLDYQDVRFKDVFQRLRSTGDLTRAFIAELNSKVGNP